MKKLCKYLFLFSVGGLIYYGIEIAWRGHSHWTMAILGGVCFILCGLINELLPWSMPLWQQMSLCALLITGAELAAGLVLNVWLGLGIWDYSRMPCNLWGQICLPYSALWIVLSVPAIVLDDWIRYWFFGESRPEYRFI